jgi:hypothetical protein
MPKNHDRIEFKREEFSERKSDRHYDRPSANKRFENEKDFSQWRSVQQNQFRDRNEFRFKGGNKYDYSYQNRFHVKRNYWNGNRRQKKPAIIEPSVPFSSHSNPTRSQKVIVHAV